MFPELGFIWGEPVLARVRAHARDLVWAPPILALSRVQVTNALTQVCKKDPQEDRENGGIVQRIVKQKSKRKNKNKPVRYHRHPGVVEPVRLCPSGHDQQPKGEVLILGCQKLSQASPKGHDQQPMGVTIILSCVHPLRSSSTPKDMINSRWVKPSFRKPETTL